MLAAILLGLALLSFGQAPGGQGRQGQQQGQQPTTTTTTQTGSQTGQQRPPQERPSPVPEETPVVTHHEITAGGKSLKYTASVGMMPIKNRDGETEARIFFMAYTLDSAANNTRRPLTFVWNGGPGMNSSLIHLLGFGPRRVKTGDVYPTSPPLSAPSPARSSHDSNSTRASA